MQQHTSHLGCQKAVSRGNVLARTIALWLKYHGEGRASLVTIMHRGCQLWNWMRFNITVNLTYPKSWNILCNNA